MRTLVGYVHTYAAPLRFKKLTVVFEDKGFWLVRLCCLKNVNAK